jgi:hypothetical protein
VLLIRDDGISDAAGLSCTLISILTGPQKTEPFPGLVGGAKRSPQGCLLILLRQAEVPVDLEPIASRS